ncbi:hypothetical protein L249_4313, partial [Ophiocordyceps polyrhachis-furcata BCC 54312]
RQLETAVARSHGLDDEEDEKRIAERRRKTGKEGSQFVESARITRGRRSQLHAHSLAEYELFRT